ncbi:phosphotransferase family protein [Deinococcus sp.]|uniref:phosphotransferase family protein n=1 Tax=Deinococcus sp. TaxID=47478 RepID=UPI003B59DBB4
MSQTQAVVPQRFAVWAVVAHPDGERVLCRDGQLPWLSLTGAVFHGEGIAQALSDLLQTELTLLRRLAYRESEVVWTLEAAKPVIQAEWLRPIQLPPAQRTWAQAALAPVPATRPLWQRPGGWAMMLRWLDEQLEAQGRPRSGEPEILKHWQISSLLRIPTSDEPVYLKAVPGFFGAEVRVTCWLSRELAGAAPPVLAADSARGLLLLGYAGEELPGERDERSPQIAERQASLEQSLALVRHLATLQRASERRMAELCSEPLSLRRRDPAWLLTRLDDVLAVPLFLIGQAQGLTRQQADGVLALRPTLEAALRALASSLIPLTLSHGDLHSGNILCRSMNGQPDATIPQRFTLIDWSDASISHPFLDINLDDLLPKAHQAAALDVYLMAWIDLLPLSVLRDLAQQAQLAGEFFRILAYIDQIQPGVEDADEWGEAHVGHYRGMLSWAARLAGVP